MGMPADSADLGKLMRSYGIDSGGVPVYRGPQTFPGIMEQTQPGQGSAYGQLSGYPTIRPYPFADPRFSLTPLSNTAPNVPRPLLSPPLSLTPLSNTAPNVPRPPTNRANKKSARTAAKKPQSKLPRVFDQRPSVLWRSGAEGNRGGGGGQ